MRADIGKECNERGKSETRKDGEREGSVDPEGAESLLFWGVAGRFAKRTTLARQDPREPGARERAGSPHKPIEGYLLVLRER
jgi:hypothetical protein